ncbi:hypothetical protein HNR77_001775 [Paenibacillus sp. JGP012]|nr:hypothetical protein [Paenibacillus sp. JGP012]
MILTDTLLVLWLLNTSMQGVFFVLEKLDCNLIFINGNICSYILYDRFAWLQNVTVDDDIF